MGINEKYKIEFTMQCLKEIKKIYTYIRDNLYAENSAKKIMNNVEKITRNLEYAPRIYAEITQYKGIHRKYRRVVIKNYVLLYTIDEEKRKIYVSHMYYGKSNYLNNF